MPNLKYACDCGHDICTTLEPHLLAMEKMLIEQYPQATKHEIEACVETAQNAITRAAIATVRSTLEAVYGENPDAMDLEKRRIFAEMKKEFSSAEKKSAGDYLDELLANMKDGTIN
jgi:hypothetical protein